MKNKNKKRDELKDERNTLREKSRFYANDRGITSKKVNGSFIFA